PLVFGFETWWMAAVFAVALIILIFPILLAVSRWRAFSSFVVERRKGEFINSMVLALSVMALSVSVCWGWMGDRYLVLACIYAWGIGDAFAALIGKRFGKHKIQWRLADGKKSIEGTLTMLLCSFVSVLPCF
ncbi:MAG: phosphatidate cytidylyltransferase, partial [Clostridia bacterium]|nr:phosphatidate cytidylyltransferase [Clostridia bacterium]